MSPPPLSEQQLIDLLTESLQDRLSLPRSRMTPDLAYGRHRGPAPPQSRVAAVAVTLYQDPLQGWTVPLTRRPTTLQHHAGQICLPGGQLEPQETTTAAALREFEEELGVRPVVRVCCGELSTQYVYASGNLVHPVVAVIEPPRGPWVPDPQEVEEVIPLPLSILLDPRHRTALIKQRSVRVDHQQVDELVFRASAYEFGGHLVWGATALILDQLAQILQPSA